MKIFKRCGCAEPEKCPHNFHYVFGFRSEMFRGSTGERTKQKAEREASIKFAEAKRGERVSGKVPKLTEYSTQFLKWIDDHQSLKPESKRYYKRGCKLLGLWAPQHSTG
jgi:hypothetical protein